MGLACRQPQNHGGTPLLCGYTNRASPVYLLRLGKGDSALTTTASEETHIVFMIVRGEHLIQSIIPEATARAKSWPRRVRYRRQCAPRRLG